MNSHSGTHWGRKSTSGPPTTGSLAFRTAHSIQRSVLPRLYLPSLGSTSTQRIGIVTKSQLASTALCKGSPNCPGLIAHPIYGGPESTTSPAPGTSIGDPGGGVSGVSLVRCAAAS